LIDNLLRRLATQRLASQRIVWLTHSGKKDPEIIVNFGRGRDCGSRVGAGAALFDGDRRREPLDKINIRLFHLVEELPRISGETFDIAALPLGIKSIERQRGLPRATQARNDNELLPWNLHMKVLQIVLAGTTNFDNLRRHSDEECQTYQSSTAIPFLQRNCPAKHGTKLFDLDAVCRTSPREQLMKFAGL